MKSRPSSPRETVHALLTKAELLLRSDLEESLRLSERALKASGSTKELAAASLAMSARIYLRRGERKPAVDLFSRALAMYDKSPDIDAALELEAEYLNAKITTGNEKNTLVRLHQILQQRIHTPYQPGRNGNTNSITPRTWRDRVLERVPSAKEIETNHQLQLAAIYDAIGTSYLVFREHHKAASFFEEELAIYRSLKSMAGISDRILEVLNNLGYVHGLLGNSVVALEYCNEGLKLARKLGDRRAIAINQRNVGQLKLQTGDTQQGKRLTMQSFQTFYDQGLIEAACRSLVTLSRYERLHGSLTAAEKLNARALKLLKGREHGGPWYYFSLQQLLVEHAKHPTKQIYTKLVALHKEAKAKKLEQENEIAREIARVAQELKLMPDAVRWSKRVHDYEIERLNAEQKYAILSLRAEQEVDRLARERELQQLQMDKLEMELKLKARETELMAVQLAKKSSFLAGLTENLASMNASQQYSKETIRAVIDLIESVRFKDKEYEHLEDRANELHHDFIVALSEQYPDLTPTEKRVCILIRLGLTNGDIASVLFTSTRTIESHALNLRRKLGIPGSVRLAKFLTNYEPNVST